MKNTRNVSLTLVAALALGVAACSNNATAPDAADTTSTDLAAGPTDAVPSDQAGGQFLTDAMKGDNSEVKLGNLATTQGSSQGVKDFGKMLVDDHGKAKDEVAQLAMSMNIPTTDETKPEADAEYTKLQGMNGADFDKELVSYMIEDHKKDIAKFQEEAKSTDPDPVTQLASKTVPTLQKHLDTAQSLQ